MREHLSADRVRDLMRALGAEATEPARVYFTGGASAVLMGWRSATIDADLHLVPDSGRLLEAIPRLKESLRLNVELACPADFIPELPDWALRSPFIAREGMVSFHHYDFYAQALSKIERGHEQDRQDVARMLADRLVEPDRLRFFFEQIRPQLYRYPALDPPSFERALAAALAG